MYNKAMRSNFESKRDTQINVTKSITVEGSQGTSLEKHIDKEFNEFMLRHEKFFKYYAGSSEIDIKSHKELHPSQQGTFAIDLKNNVIYAAMDVFKDKGYEENASFFAMLHEFEHFREIQELSKYYDAKKRIYGSDIWKRHYQKMSQNKALHILDNCIDDIKMNRTVLERAPSLTKTKTELYKTFNFPEDDLRNQPLHLQLAYALLRRRMLPESETIIDSRVEESINRIQQQPIDGQNIVDYMTSPEINMAERLMLQEALIEPEFLKLMEEAKKDLDKNEKDEHNLEGQEGQEGSTKAGQSDTETEESTSINNDPFEDYYKEYEEKNPQATQLEDINKALEDYFNDPEYKNTQTKKQSSEKSLEQRQIEALAKKAEVSVQDIRQYQRFWKEIADLKNPKTGETVVSELRDVFRKIVTKRKPPITTLRSNLDEGAEIENYADVIVSTASGKPVEKVYADFEKQEKPKEFVGNFDVSFVCDRSGSMEGENMKQQRIAVGLFLEMFSEFTDLIKEASLTTKNSLEVQTEVWGFGGESQVGIIKPMSEDLTLSDRVSAYKTLSDCPGGSTLDYRPLEEINKNISEQEVENIQKGNHKKIIIVISDGDSSRPSDLKNAIYNLHQKGVHVVAIGLGDEAEVVAKNYPNSIMCPSPHNLGPVTADLLAHISKDI